MKGGITLSEIDRMSITDYQLLKHAVAYIIKQEKKEMEKTKK